MRKDRNYPNEYDAGSYPIEPDPQSGQPYTVEMNMDSMYFAKPARHANKLVMRLAIFLIIISIALILLQSVLFRVKTLYVIGNSISSAEHITALSGIKKDDTILSVSEDKVRDSLKADHWIILLHLYKQYPNEVYLFVDERKVVATMQWLGIEYTLDIYGMVLEEHIDMDYIGNIPVVHGFRVDNAIVGEFLTVRSEKQLIAYSSIISELTIQRYADHIVSINVSDTELLSLLTTNGITVQLGNSNYMRAKIGAMRTDIAYLQQLGETSGVLDVTVPEDGKFRRE